jgi:hypothetical protein
MIDKKFMSLSAKEMEQALSEMDEDLRDHLRFVISSLIECYLDEDTHGLVMINNNNRDGLALIALNATEMDAAEMMIKANEHINAMAMQDAPPKEKFN